MSDGDNPYEDILRTLDSMAATIRKTFEDKCLCMVNHVFERVDSSVSDHQAVSFYESKCKCICNYVDVNRLTIDSTRMTMRSTKPAND